MEKFRLFFVSETPAAHALWFNCPLQGFRLRPRCLLIWPQLTPVTAPPPSSSPHHTAFAWLHAARLRPVAPTHTFSLLPYVDDVTSLLPVELAELRMCP